MTQTPAAFAWQLGLDIFNNGVLPIVLAAASGYVGVRYATKQAKDLIAVDLEKTSKTRAFTYKSDLYIEVATLVVRMRKEAAAIKLHRDLQATQESPELARLAGLHGDIDADKVEAIGNLFGDISLGENLSQLVSKRNDLVRLFNNIHRESGTRKLLATPQQNIDLGRLFAAVDEGSKFLLAQLRYDLNG